MSKKRGPGISLTTEKEAHVSDFLDEISNKEVGSENANVFYMGSKSSLTEKLCLGHLPCREFY